MTLTAEEQAALDALLAKASQQDDNDAPAEAAAEVVAEVGPEVVEVVGDVAQTVAAVVAHEVGDAAQGEADRLAAENRELREQVAVERQRAEDAATLAAAAVQNAVETAEAAEPERPAEEPAVIDLADDTPPSDAEDKPSAYFRRVRMPWQRA